MERQELHNYLKKLGIKEEKIPGLIKYFEKELENITITVVNPKGTWNKEPEEKEQK